MRGGLARSIVLSGSYFIKRLALRQKSVVIDSASTGSDSDRIKVRPQNKVLCYSKNLLDPVATAPGTDTFDFCSKAKRFTDC